MYVCVVCVCSVFEYNKGWNSEFYTINSVWHTVHALSAKNICMHRHNGNGGPTNGRPSKRHGRRLGNAYIYTALLGSGSYARIYSKSAAPSGASI